MSRSRILFILGTRSEAIKGLPVIRALEAGFPEVAVRVGATGQHGVLFQQIADLAGLRPAWNLEAMRPRQSACELLGGLLQLLDPVLRREQPDCVAALGDSASTTAVAIAARLAMIPFFHLEAGLRGGASEGHYPQETSRKLITAAASAHLPPTGEARENLLREGVPDTSIGEPADAGLDALAAHLRDSDPPGDPELADLDWTRPVAVATLVRRENHQDPAIEICRALLEAARRAPETQFVFVSHLNPHLMGPVRSIFSESANTRVTLPLPHGAFAGLLRRADFVLTDSGGVLEEATALGVPVVLLTDARETGRALGAGRVLRAGADAAALADRVCELAMAAIGVKERPARGLPAFPPAGPRIAAQLANWARRPE